MLQPSSHHTARPVISYECWCHAIGQESHSRNGKDSTVLLLGQIEQIFHVPPIICVYVPCPHIDWSMWLTTDELCLNFVTQCCRNSHAHQYQILRLKSVLDKSILLTVNVRLAHYRDAV